jgi:flagellar biosynthesis anti-sigma factor FlgM
MYIGEGPFARSENTTHSEVRETSRTTSQGHDATVGKQPGPANDAVTLSNEIYLLQQALQAGSQSRASRIAELREQFQQGGYTVDTKALSQALVADMFAGL